MLSDNESFVCNGGNQNRAHWACKKCIDKKTKRCKHDTWGKLTQTDNLWSKTVLSSMTNPPWEPWASGTSFSSISYKDFIEDPGIVLDDGSVFDASTHDFSGTKSLNSEIEITTEITAGFKIFDRDNMLYFDVSIGIGTKYPILRIRPICFLPNHTRIYKFSVIIDEIGVDYFWMLDPKKSKSMLSFPMNSIPQPPPGHWVLKLIFRLE